MRVVSFGKYQGWSYEDVCRRHPGYIMWMASKFRPTSEASNDFRAYCIGITARKLLYVLPLSDGKYYVGITSFPVHRLKQHRIGKGSRWTRLHRPVRGFLKLQAIPSDITPGIYEDMWVKELMCRFGTEAVRGGSYSNVWLEDAQIKTIQREISHATRQTCIRHFDASCAAITPPQRSVRKVLDVTSSSPRRLQFDVNPEI